MLFFKKKTDPGQPRPDWPWALTVGPAAPKTTLNWADIRSALEGLIPDTDSFVILEQKDPKDPKKYWYIQSAIATAGPDRGKYTVGYGWMGGKRAEMWERMVPSAAEALPYFEAAWKDGTAGLAGFEDHSGWLPANNK